MNHYGRSRALRISGAVKTLAGAAALMVVAAVATGCTGNPSAGSPAYKAGELGNGGFLFNCDDSVACDRWTTNNAKDFPDTVATGAAFNVRFVASGDQTSVDLTINSPKYNGVIETPIAPFMSSGPDGMTTVKPGYGVIAARDSRGYIVDYVTIRIVKPTGLIIYDAKYKGDDPTKLETITLKKDETQQYRAVGEYDKQKIAGSIRVSWKSADSNIAEVVSYTKGVVTVKGKAAGKTKLTASGAALDQDVNVEVTEVTP